MDFKNSNLLKLTFFYIYFASRLILLVINTYLPIVFFNVFGVDKAELAFIQIFSYLALFAKPLAGFYFDKHGSKFRVWLIFSSISIVLSFFFLLTNLALLFIFGILLGTTFGFISVIDVIIDKIIQHRSADEEERKKNARWMNSGTLFATAIGTLLYLLLVGDPTVFGSWAPYFIAVGVLLIPLVVFSILLREDSSFDLESEKVQKKPINRTSLLLLGIFLVLFSSSGLYQWGLEPWILEKYGSAGFSLYNIFVLFWLILELAAIFIAGSKKDWRNTQVLYYGMIGAGILYMIAPFFIFLLFLVFISIAVFLAGFIGVSLVALNLNISGNRAFAFQTISTCGVIGQVLFTPLGTFLAGVIPVEVLLVLAGVFFISAGIIAHFINEEGPLHV